MEGVNHKNLQPPLGDDACISMVAFSDSRLIQLPTALLLSFAADVRLVLITNSIRLPDGG
jgi:hypothetical protein